MAVKPREKPKAVRRNDYKVHILTTIFTQFFYPCFFAFVIVTPVVAVQTVSLIFNFGWMNAIALVVIIIGTNAIGIILTHIYDGRAWKEILGYFRDFDDCLFEPITIDINLKIIKDILHYPLEMIPFLERYSVQRIRAFYVHPTGDILPSTITTYHIKGGASYAFLPQRPEKMNSLARFYLFHEIGHGAVTNSFNLEFDWHSSVYFCLLFVFVAFHREAGILELLIAFAIVAMWAHYLDLQHLQQQRNRDERPEELVADVFALVHLAERSDFRTTISRIARNFCKQSKESPFWRYRARLLVQRAQILSRRKKEFKLGWEKGLRMNWSEHLIPPVPRWLVALSLSGMVWLGTTLSIKDWEELLALSLVWVVVPILDHSYRMLRKVPRPSTAQARLEALEFLRAHAPPNLSKDKQVNTVSDLF